MRYGHLCCFWDQGPSEEFLYGKLIEKREVERINKQAQEQCMRNHKGYRDASERSIHNSLQLKNLTEKIKEKNEKEQMQQTHF